MSKSIIRRVFRSAGIDAGKQVNGRKRFILVDTLGLLWLLLVLTADHQECHGGWFGNFRRLSKDY